MKRSYFPSGTGITVALIFKIGHILNHPVVNLAEGQSLLWRSVDGLSDQIGVRHIAPGVPSRRILFRSARTGHRLIQWRRRGVVSAVGQCLRHNRGINHFSSQTAVAVDITFTVGELGYVRSRQWPRIGPASERLHISIEVEVDLIHIWSDGRISTKVWFNALFN